MGMNELQIFENAEFGKIRMVEIEGKPYAVGVDVARALEYARPADAITAHCGGSVKYRVLTNGGMQEVKVIPQGDILRLIVGASKQSKSETIKAKAKKFESWIFDEVIPQVLRTGQYKVQTLEEQVAQGLIAAHKIIAEKDKQIAVMQPKALFADAVTASSNSILIRDLAKLLSQNGVPIGQNRLYERLRQEGYLIKSGSDKNMPTQRAMEMKLFEIKEGTRLDGNGVNVTTRTTKVTGKGQVYFINRYLKKDVS